MGESTDLELTPRQQAVAELIAQRRSHKEIALELGISPARVSQYVRRLKDHYNVETLGGIAQAYRALSSPRKTPPYRFSRSTDFNLPETDIPPQIPLGDEPTRLPFADISAASTQSDWPGLSRMSSEPRLVPGMLDGKYGTVLRIGWMFSAAIGAFAVAILALATGEALTDLLARFS